MLANNTSLFFWAFLGGAAATFCNAGFGAGVSSSSSDEAKRSMSESESFFLVGVSAAPANAGESPTDSSTFC